LDLTPTVVAYPTALQNADFWAKVCTQIIIHPLTVSTEPGIVLPDPVAVRGMYDLYTDFVMRLKYSLYTYPWNLPKGVLVTARPISVVVENPPSAGVHAGS